MAGKYFAMFSWSRGMSLILLTKWRNKVGVTASVGSNITWKNKVAWEVSWTLVVIYPSWWEVRECETAFGQLCERKTRPYYNVLQLGLQRDILQHQQILKNHAPQSFRKPSTSLYQWRLLLFAASFWSGWKLFHDLGKVIALITASHILRESRCFSVLANKRFNPLLF